MSKTMTKWFENVLAIGVLIFLGCCHVTEGQVENKGENGNPPSSSAAIEKYVYNIKDFGAKGDGKADDSDAIQRAIDATQKNHESSEVFLPTGLYRVTKTLIFERGKCLIFRGQGSSSLSPKPGATTLVWDGPAGGTLLSSLGITGCVFQDFNLSGRMDGKKKEDGQAGVLFGAQSTRRAGQNFINKFSDVCFYYADIGIEMGSAGKDAIDAGNSDYYFEFVCFRGLDRGFVVKNAQGVNYLFNFLFANECGKVLHFEKGGCLQVNDAQLTACDTFLEICAGGRCGAIYTCVNIHMECGGGTGGGKNARHQLLRCLPVKDKQVSVKFISFADAQWNWVNNQTATRETPLCEIGPGSMVVIENSLFNGPVGSLTGTGEHPANLVLRECSFGYIKPETAVRANKFGFFKIINPVSDDMQNLPDVIKWPELKPIEIKNEDHAPSWK